MAALRFIELIMWNHLTNNLDSTYLVGAGPSTR